MTQLAVAASQAAFKPAALTCTAVECLRLLVIEYTAEEVPGMRTDWHKNGKALLQYRDRNTLPRMA